MSIISKKPDQSRELDEQNLPHAKAGAKFARVSPAAAPSRTVKELLHELQVCQDELEMRDKELRRSQILLEESHNHYVDFYDSAPVGYLTLTDKGLISEINLAGAALLGVERDKLLRKRLARFVAPEDKNLWRRHFPDVLKHDKKLVCELAFKRGDGSGVTVQLDCLRLAKEGKVLVVRVVLADITWRKQVEQIACKQEEFFRLITENIDDFIAVLDLEGRRIYSNPAYIRFFGDAKDTNFFTHIHPSDQKYVMRIFRDAARSGFDLQIEFRFVLADGSIRHVESHGGLIGGSQDQTLHMILVSHDITAHKQDQEKIRQLAFYDALTGLPNRHLLGDRLAQAMAASKRSGRYCALIFLDLDNFKPLNDKYGHIVGDLLLVEVARRIRNCVRKVDTVSRFGGDEFVVLLSEVNIDKTKSIEEVSIIAEKIRVALARPYVLKNQQENETETIIEHLCTSSIGMEMFLDHEIGQNDLLIHADLAMYQAKQEGRNRTCFFDSNAPPRPAGDVAAAVRRRAEERLLRAHQTKAGTFHELPAHQIKLDFGVEPESNSSTAPADRRGKVP